MSHEAEPPLTPPEPREDPDDHDRGDDVHEEQRHDHGDRRSGDGERRDERDHQHHHGHDAKDGDRTPGKAPSSASSIVASSAGTMLLVTTAPGVTGCPLASTSRGIAPSREATP
jgi:hypothetical protein